MLYALQIVFLFGNLEPGAYRYRKPVGDQIEYSPLVVEGMPQSSEFHFTSEHRELLRWSMVENSEVGWEGQTVPGCDPKRPYGDFTYYQLEMAKHLNRPTTENEEGYNEISDETEEELTQLHHSMQAAWQVFIDNFELSSGEFRGDVEWQRSCIRP